MRLKLKLQVADLARERQHLGRDLDALGQVGRVPQHPAPRPARVRECLRVPQLGRDRRRLLAERRHPVPIGRVVHGAAQACEQTHPDQRPLGLELERPLDHRDQLGVDHAGRLHVLARGPDRGARQRGAVAEPLGQSGRLAKGGGPERTVAAPDAGLADAQQQLAAAVGRFGLEAPLHVEGARVVLGRLLVREHRGRLLAGADRVRDRLFRVLRITGAREVVRELGQVALLPAALRGFDRLADPLVEARPPRRRHALVKRLPNQRVRDR